MIMLNRVALVVLVAIVFPARALAQTDADFFDPDKLQEIRLELHPNDWALLKKNFLEDTYYACVFHWMFNGKDIASPEIAVRSRGQGSRSGIKPSLLVKFDHYESRQGFLGLKSVVLRANTQDASMMHERVSMEFFKRLGMPAARETHAKVFVNGEYAGLYTIVESVDKTFVKSRFGEDSGYLYNYQYQDEFYFEDRGSNPATYSPVPFEPEFSKDQTPNAAPIASMVQAINKASDQQFQASVSQFVDLKAFLTEVAAENFIAEQDGLVGDYGLNNFYLYRFAGKNLHTLIPWDKSNTFFSLDWPIMRRIETNVLSRRALKVPELLDLYRSVLARAADIAGGRGGWLEGEINKEYQQIRQAAYADPFKLCDPGAIGVLRPCSNDQFDGEVAGMLAFARRRAFDVQVELAGGISSQNFTVSNQGGFTTTAAGAATDLKVGYARIQSDAGNARPAGLAIFSLRNGDTIVSEAAVPASSLIRSGRIYAEISGPVNTGVAIANPNDEPATLSFYFTDATGRDFGGGTTSIPANGQMAQFLNRAPFNSGALATGSFTFASSVPVAAIALRGMTNERSDFLITTLPVAPTARQSGSLMFPHFADGGGWTTQVILVNPSDEALTGSLQFFSSDGVLVSGFSYSIPAHGSFRLQSAGTSDGLTTGSVRVVPAADNATPSGVSIFSFRNAGVTLTEAGIPAARAGSAFRLYAESSGDFAHSQTGSVQTGIAIANSGASPAIVNLELADLEGTFAGLMATITVAANGQTALFLNQVPGLAALPASFQGVLRISSPAAISVTGLRGRYNQRGDFLITTTPPVAEDEPAAAANTVFPQIVEGAGYTTQFILFSGGPGQAASGTLQYFSQDGQPLKLGIR